MKQKLVILLCIISIIGLTGCTSTKTSENKKTSNDQNLENKNKGKEINVTKEMYDLINKTTPPQDSSYETYFYTNDKVTVESMDNQLKLLLGASNYNREIPNQISMTKENMEFQLKDIFGPNINYTDESFSAGSCYGNIAEYNNNYYRFEGGCGGMYMPYYKNKITKAISYDDRLELFVQALYFSYDMDQFDGMNESSLKLNLFDADQKKKIDTISNTEDDVISNYQDQLTTYKYTFLKEKDHYYFTSVEKQPKK